MLSIKYEPVILHSQTTPGHEGLNVLPSPAQNTCPRATPEATMSSKGPHYTIIQADGLYPARSLFATQSVLKLSD
jgi:hypothetical protein